MRLYSPLLERRPHLALRRRLKNAGFVRNRGYYLSEEKDDVRIRIHISSLKNGRAYDVFVGYVVPSVNRAIAELRARFPFLDSHASGPTGTVTSNKLSGLLGYDRAKIWVLPPTGEDTVDRIGDDIEIGCRKLTEKFPTHDAIRNGIIDRQLHGEGGSEFTVPMFMAQRKDVDGFTFIADRILGIPVYHNPEIRDYLTHLNATYLDDVYSLKATDGGK